MPQDRRQSVAPLIVRRLRRIEFALLLCLLPTLAAPARASTPWEEGLAQIELHLDAGLDAYRANDAEAADQQFSDAYFVTYEASGLEIAVRQFLSAKRNYQLEKMFRNLRLLVQSRAPLETLEQAAEQLRVVLAEDVKALRGFDHGDFFAGAEDPSSASASGKEATTSPTALRRGGAFAESLLIIVREGFEAILLLGALIAYASRAGGRREVRVIYQAAGAAIVASLITAYTFERILAVSPARQEVVEGLTMLLASAVLFYVSYWLISKAEGRRWQAYIRGKVDAALGTGRRVTLGAAAFLAIYREGAETVLFYRALGAGMGGARREIGLGFVAGSLLLVLLFVLFRQVVRKLPIGPFFAITSGFLFLLAFVFAGKGIHELQEGDLVGDSPLSFVPHIEPLGIFPSLQSTAVQSLFVVALALVMVRWLRSREAAANEVPTTPGSNS